MNKTIITISVLMTCFLLVQGASAVTDISSCTVITSSGDYQLTADILGSTDTACIDITTSDVVLDCQGHVINGVKTSATRGIRVERTSSTNTNITIKNCVVTDWTVGVYLKKTHNNTLINNTALNNKYGIYVYVSKDNTIINNTANSNEEYGIYLRAGSDYNSLSGTVANSNSIHGIYVYESDNGSLTGNIANLNNENGFHIIGSKGNTVLNNNANSNGNDGFYISVSKSNIFSDNTANSNDEYGIYLRSGSDKNTFSGNTITSNNNYGIYLINSDRNIFSGNNVTSNNDHGIYLLNSENNTIYNNYLNNTINAYDNSNNFWNTTNQSGTNIIGGLNIGGNYFSDYNYTDTNGDGFGEIPYNISGGSNTDYLPLAIPEVPTIFLSIGMMFLALAIGTKNIRLNV